MSKSKAGRDVVPGLGEAMRTVREKCGLTLAEVAEWIGTGTAALSKIELGRRSPSARLVFAWSRAIGVSLDELAADAARIADHPSR